jgi:hypothetical protein
MQGEYRFAAGKHVKTEIWSFGAAPDAVVVCPLSAAYSSAL